MFYPGHLLTSPNNRAAKFKSVVDILRATRAALAREGILVKTISGGSTPTAYESHFFDGLTEIRPGMYPFYDRNMMGIGVAGVHDCAVTVMVTVVSTAVPGKVIVDGGSKTFSSDRFLAGDRTGFGFVKEDETATFEAMSEEHGHLDISRSTRPYRIGERLHIIPNHVCTTINMHNLIYGVYGENVDAEWHVLARGEVT